MLDQEFLQGEIGAVAVKMACRRCEYYVKTH